MIKDDLFRPFAILKLIRDGKVKNVKDLFFISPSTFFSICVEHLLEGLAELGLIKLQKNGKLKPTKKLKILLKSLNISLTQLSDYSLESVVCSPIFGSPSEPPVKADVFVLMPFLDELKPIYDDHICKVVNNLGLTVARADDFSGAESIILDIWNAINACRVVVADCTGKNPNVFYEIGIAHTLGKPVILISQSIKDIPFNIQHLRTILYDFTPRGMRDFEQQLAAAFETEISRNLSIEEYMKLLIDSSNM